MHKVDLPVDGKELAIIARRRQQEEDRKKRIFDSKERIYGKDFETLKKQLDEKRYREQQEKQLNQAYEEEALRQSKIALELESRMLEDKRNAYEEVQSYRLHCQKFEDRREFDLNDPDMVRNTLPARLNDEDPRCGASSFQKFDGEDIYFKDRVKDQEGQKQRWLDAQIQEKRNLAEKLKKAEEVYNRRMVAMDQRALMLQAAEMEAKVAVDNATRQFNNLLGNEVAERKALAKRVEEEANVAHRFNMMRSELLSEIPYGNDDKIPREKFKGFCEEDLDKIRSEQEKQIMEMKDRANYEKQIEKSWEQLKMKQSIAARIIDKELNERKLEHLREIKRENLELAREQRARQEQCNQVLKNNVPTEDYHKWFNTTSR